MQEYVTHAVVLDKMARNDADARYAFFTQRYGKIAARAKSSRKIVSKLAGHLEPGTLAAVRIIEQHGAQVVDALSAGAVAIPMRDLSALSNLLPEWQPDAELWHEITKHHSAAGDGAMWTWKNALAILGWDPRGAICTRCHTAARAAAYFYMPRQEFFCASCTAASRFVKNDLLLIS